MAGPPLPALPDALYTDNHEEHIVLNGSLCCSHLGTALPRPVSPSKKQPSLFLWLFLHEMNHYKAKEYHLRRNAVRCQLSCFLSHKAFPSQNTRTNNMRWMGTPALNGEIKTRIKKIVHHFKSLPKEGAGGKDLPSSVR